jgi:hypothetical protein
MESSGQVVTLIQLVESNAVKILGHQRVGWAVVALGDNEGPFLQFQRAPEISERGQRCRKESERQRDRRMIGSQRTLRERDCTLRSVPCLQQLALEPELVGDQVQGAYVGRVIDVRGLLDCLGAP